MKTKPFNLEEALAGAKVVTRSGKAISQLTFFKDVINSYPLYAVIDENIEVFDIEGRYISDNAEHDKDLFLEVAVNKIYVNVYEGKNGLFVGHRSFTDKETAIINKNNVEDFQTTYIKTIEITEEP